MNISGKKSKRSPPAERFDLWRDLASEFEESLSAESEWDAEIESRVKDVVEGRVELVSGDDVSKQMDVLFADLGIDRQRPT